MKMTKIKIQGFKCFNESTEFDLNPLTTLIGSNGVGKTAVLEALNRMFCIEKSRRKIKNSDFYIPAGEQLDSKEARFLAIEVRIDFPLIGTGGEESEIPGMFGQMVIDSVGEPPYCRILLKADWSISNIPDGEITENMYWIRTAAEQFSDNDCQLFKPSDRNKIHLHYIPANRDPQNQLRQTVGTIMYQLLRAVNWSEGIKENINSYANELQEAFQRENGVKTIQSTFSNNWKSFFNSHHYSEVNLSPLSSDFNDIITRVEALFSPNPEGHDDSPEKLSDGMRSLFYLTLISSLFDIQDKIGRDIENHGFNPEHLNQPLLTIFAIEEPENHLSPHYIGKVLKAFKRLLENNKAQVIISSHSTSILHRIEPEEIRYLRLKQDRSTEIKKILLPEETDEAYKYVKNAVKAYPELYFSKAVLLGEGDSEEIVLPIIAEALETSLDSSFVSMVPLGGRHVNHFWRLLNDLKIPHITLLDYDRGRGGGDWGRIQYVIKELLKNEVISSSDLKGESGEILDYELMHEWKSDNELEIKWIKWLGEKNVFFSYPIDLDFLMYSHYKTSYQSYIPENGGPRIPKSDDPQYIDKVKNAVASVLKKEKEDIGNIPRDFESYYWYRYLFLGRGKPVSHIHAMSVLDKSDLVKNCPSVFKKIIEKLDEYIAD